MFFHVRYGTKATHVLCQLYKSKMYLFLKVYSKDVDALLKPDCPPPFVSLRLDLFGEDKIMEKALPHVFAVRPELKDYFETCLFSPKRVDNEQYRGSAEVTTEEVERSLTVVDQVDDGITR